jgi:capsular polysaccharide biosynthesis protein
MVWEDHQRFGQYSTTYITVSAPTTPKPTISPSHTSMVAGQSFTMSWSTTNATSLKHVCTASGTGYTVNESLATSGSRTMTAQAGWVSYP